MRRELSPREAVFRKFRSLEKRFEDLKRNVRNREDLLRFEMFEDLMLETRDLALSLSIEAGPVNADRLATLIQSGSREKAVGFMHKHLLRQSPMMLVEGIDPEKLALSCLAKLQALDLERDFNAEMSRIAIEIAEEHSLPARSWAVHSIETLCREALGIDGRMPDKDEKRSISNARDLLVQAQANEHHISPP